MNCNERDKRLLEKIKLLNPDYIPVVNFKKPINKIKPFKSRVIKTALMAAVILSLVVVISINTAKAAQTPGFVQKERVIKIIISDTMNPNQLWHKKQLVVSINNGELK